MRGERHTERSDHCGYRPFAGVVGHVIGLRKQTIDLHGKQDATSRAVVDPTTGNPLSEKEAGGHIKMHRFLKSIEVILKEVLVDIGAVVVDQQVNSGLQLVGLFDQIVKILLWWLGNINFQDLRACTARAAGILRCPGFVVFL